MNIVISVVLAHSRSLSMYPLPDASVTFPVEEIRVVAPPAYLLFSFVSGMLVEAFSQVVADEALVVGLPHAQRDPINVHAPTADMHEIARGWIRITLLILEGLTGNALESCMTVVLNAEYLAGVSDFTGGLLFTRSAGS